MRETVAGDPGENAAARAKSARERAQELQARRRRLLSGEPATPEDVARAEQAARLEQQHSAEAHIRAAGAHVRAAEAHRRASGLLEAAGQAEQAAEHRRLALLDDDAAAADVSGASIDDRH